MIDLIITFKMYMLQVHYGSKYGEDIAHIVGGGDDFAYLTSAIRCLLLVAIACITSA
ncbi:MAG: hypothetical protein ACP5UV_07155 [Thermoplasmata archaeon]